MEFDGNNGRGHRVRHNFGALEGSARVQRCELNSVRF